MKKRILSMILASTLTLSLAGCGEATVENTTPDATDVAVEETNANKSLKIGLICIGDENDLGYTYNFIRGKEDSTAAMAELGIDLEWVIKWNISEDSSCEDANIELAEEGCDIIINNSFGFEPFMTKVAKDYPHIQFIGCTSVISATDNLDNTHNAFADIYEGRYMMGVAAGLKMQEMIDNGEITEDGAIIGYVGAFSFAEVISGFTAHYLGAKSVCPSATMKVQFVGSWSDATAEGNAAAALCDMGAVMISQHSDNTSPATTAQAKGAYHTGYNNDMISVAPEASLMSTRIDWSVYFNHVFETVANGGTFDQDWCAGINEGAVVMTALNEDLAAAGTAEKLAEVEAGLRSGDIQVFDTTTFTIDGEELTSAYAMDTDGDYVPDTGEAVFDGTFNESYHQSSPYFALNIDGIEWLNSAF